MLEFVLVRCFKCRDMLAVAMRDLIPATGRNVVGKFLIVLRLSQSLFGGIFFLLLLFTDPC